MGWKTLRDRFDLERHIVQVTPEGVCIGSPMVYDLLVVDNKTGAVSENPTFRGTGKKSFAALMAASRQEILDALRVQDEFSGAIPVYTCENGLVVERFCEKLGWPNVTHEGYLMRSDTYSTNRGEAVDRARRLGRNRIKAMEGKLASLHEQASELEGLLGKERQDLTSLAEF